jgi:hypothetical protein
VASHSTLAGAGRGRFGPTAPGSAEDGRFHSCGRSGKEADWLRGRLGNAAHPGSSTGVPSLPRRVHQRPCCENGVATTRGGERPALGGRGPSPEFWMQCDPAERTLPQSSGPGALPSVPVHVPWNDARQARGTTDKDVERCASETVADRGAAPPQPDGDDTSSPWTGMKSMRRVGPSEFESESLAPQARRMVQATPRPHGVPGGGDLP